MKFWWISVIFYCGCTDIVFFFFFLYGMCCIAMFIDWLICGEWLLGFMIFLLDVMLLSSDICWICCLVLLYLWVLFIDFFGIAICNYYFDSTRPSLEGRLVVGEGFQVPTMKMEKDLDLASMYDFAVPSVSCFREKRRKQRKWIATLFLAFQSNHEPFLFLVLTVHSIFFFFFW